MKCFASSLFVNVDVQSSVKIIYSYLAVNNSSCIAFSSLFRSIEYSSILEQILCTLLRWWLDSHCFIDFSVKVKNYYTSQNEWLTFFQFFSYFCFFVLYVVISLLLPSVQKQLSIYCVVEQEAENVLKKIKQMRDIWQAVIKYFTYNTDKFSIFSLYLALNFIINFRQRDRTNYRTLSQ